MNPQRHLRLFGPLILWRSKVVFIIEYYLKDQNWHLASQCMWYYFLQSLLVTPSSFWYFPTSVNFKFGTLELMIQMRDEYCICFSLLLKLGYFLWDYIKTILKIVSIGTSAPWVIHWKSVLNNLFLKCVFLICGDKLLVSRMECPVGIRVDRFVWSQLNFDVVCSKN